MPDSADVGTTAAMPDRSTGHRIVRPERVPVRALWASESADFTPWLAANLDFLDDVGLGPLTHVRTEAQLPGLGRSLDILAQTTDGRRVAIENQYSSIDHDHLTRGLAYAVGHDARALVVVAEEHRPEFVAVADYLNHAQEALGDEQGIAVFLVALTVERIDDAYVPRFAVLSQPNAWRAVLAAQDAAKFASLEDFLAACEEGVRPMAQQVVRDWLEGAGSSIRFSKTGVSLDVRNPFKAGGSVTSVFVLFTNGQLSLNRGYLLEGGLIPEPSAARLDEQIRRLFPSGRWGKGSYYVAVPSPPEPDAVRAFRRWFDAHLSGLSGFSGRPTGEVTNERRDGTL
jgi:hypothetical protein